MEVGTDDRGFRDLGAGHQDLFHFFYIVEDFGVAPVELDEQVPT